MPRRRWSKLFLQDRLWQFSRYCPIFESKTEIDMIDETTLAQINGAYVCPPDAGPEWRAAHEAGIDMSLIEHALELTPEQRLEEHQQVIDFLLEIQGAALANGAG